MWQYTDGALGPKPHTVRCDRDKFNGSEAQLRKLWGVQAHHKGRETDWKAARPDCLPLNFDLITRMRKAANFR